MFVLQKLSLDRSYKRICFKNYEFIKDRKQCFFCQIGTKLALNSVKFIKNLQ
jgi:hypothetical protein